MYTYLSKIPLTESGSSIAHNVSKMGELAHSSCPNDGKSHHVSERVTARVEHTPLPLPLVLRRRKSSCCLFISLILTLGVLLERPMVLKLLISPPRKYLLFCALIVLLMIISMVVKLRISLWMRV